jgi:hypothetical protein
MKSIIESKIKQAFRALSWGKNNILDPIIGTAKKMGKDFERYGTKKALDPSAMASEVKKGMGYSLGPEDLANLKGQSIGKMISSAGYILKEYPKLAISAGGLVGTGVYKGYNSTADVYNNVKDNIFGNNSDNDSNNSIIDYAKENPGHAAAGLAGLVGASLAAKKYMNSRKTK